MLPVGSNMAVWSSISRVFSGPKQLSKFVLARFAQRNVGPIRQMSDHNRFQVEPSRWQWHKTKDLMHLYIIVGAIPLGLISLYANLFIGPAQLAPIPDGYVPKEWEYYRHPITRFFKKYLMESDQEAYEKHCHFCYEVVDESEFKRIEKEVREMQKSRGDYQHWFYIPMETHTYQVVQEAKYEMEKEMPAAV